MPRKSHRCSHEKIGGSESFKNVLDYKPLYIDKCIDLKIYKKQIYVVQINIEIKLTNTSSSPSVEPIIWTGVDQGDSIETVLFHVSKGRFFKESRRRVSLKSIVDINTDGQHEIILEDERYAGSSYIIFNYENGELNSQDIVGDSWD